MRIKSRWHNKAREKTPEEIAGALGFICWRIASATVNKLYNAGFNFSSNAQQLDVIGEFAAFMLQVVDRWAYDAMEDEERQRFVGALAGKLIDTMVDNRVEELGPGEYRDGFVQLLNERMEGYAEFAFVDGQPSYQGIRYFAICVDRVMGGTENKWVMEQIIEVETPETLKTLRKGYNDLFAPSEPAESAS